MADLVELLRETIKSHVDAARDALKRDDLQAANEHYEQAERRVGELGEALEAEDRRQRRERA